MEHLYLPTLKFGELFTVHPGQRKEVNWVVNRTNQTYRVAGINESLYFPKEDHVVVSNCLMLGQDLRGRAPVTVTPSTAVLQLTGKVGSGSRGNRVYFSVALNDGVVYVSVNNSALLVTRRLNEYQLPTDDIELNKLLNMEAV